MSVLLDIITRLKGRIEGGSEYGWECFGPNARYLDFPNVGVIFDSETQEVYAIDAWPNNYDENATSYFWVNNVYEVAHRKECEKRKCLPEGEQCYSFPSMLAIAEAVMDELPFDEELARDVELFFEDGELEMVMNAAKESGMTLDEFVNAALKEKLDSVKSQKKAQKRAK
jgi:hypothetical protein